MDLFKHFIENNTFKHNKNTEINLKMLKLFFVRVLLSCPTLVQVKTGKNIKPHWILGDCCLCKHVLWSRLYRLKVMLQVRFYFVKSSRLPLEKKIVYEVHICH